MIAMLRGRVVSFTIDTVVLDVAGVGYLVRCTPATIGRMATNQEAEIFTSMVVREDSMTLYGFATTDERNMFELVQTASGVGPKVGLAMVSSLEPDTIRAAITQGDVAVLTSVPGIGRKGAERIIVELKDRIGVSTRTSSVGAPAWRAQVHDALLGLGWSARDADRAVDGVADELPEGELPDVSILLRQALRSLSKR